MPKIGYDVLAYGKIDVCYYVEVDFAIKIK